MRVETTYERFEYDFYPTPPSCVEAIYKSLEDIIDYEDQLKVFDPGAGTGIWGQVYKHMYNSLVLVGLDIQDLPFPNSYDGWISGTDFLTYELSSFKGHYDLVVGNPPYKYAEEFVRRGLELVPEGGKVVFLLRLAFLESMKRCEGLYKEFPPRRVAVLARRPSFHLIRKTGSSAYGVFVWEKGWEGPTELTWLNWNYSEKWEGLVEDAKEQLVNIGAMDYVES